MIRARLVLTALLLSLGFGCFPSFSGVGGCGDDEVVLPTCNQPYTGASLDGRWQISAHGQRSDCEDRRLEGKLVIETTVALSIDANAQATSSPATGPDAGGENDAFVQRIERADFELGGEELPEPVSLYGTVQGSCVQLQLTERLEAGDQLEYQLHGFIDDVGVVHGSFTGRGPERCLSSGEFTAQVR